ncbi:MAG: 1,4-alpha-glucan branching protein GlgB [Thiotrichales bacterium]
MKLASPNLTQDHHKLINGHHHDPFGLLGRHPIEGGRIRVTVFAPHLETLALEDPAELMQRLPDSDFFAWEGAGDAIPPHYRLHALTKTGHRYGFHDPYSFAPQLAEFDLHLFSQGNHWHAYRVMGAHAMTVDDIPGVRFATWAPNAARVSVVGDFNQWDGRRHPMRSRGSSGVWELFIPELESGGPYKFEILNRDHGTLVVKTDPYGQAFEYRPRTASVIAAPSTHQWHDNAWLEQRRHFDWQHAPVSIYEVHLGSWRRDEEGEFLNYRELAERLGAHVKQLGFTHIELLPITEHPLDASWGYQVTGYYAPTSRFGTPDDFRYFVDHLHQLGIGIILDWVPAHFPKDEWALAGFDGTPLYEHADPRKGEHRDWGTKIFNFGRNEVKNFLISSAIYWIEEFHLDGIRVDAVASMLYLDYSRDEGDWLPNQYGGRENLEAIEFLQHVNSVIGQNHHGVLMIAEESTAWPMVSRPTYLGGLGFSMKWNMGWMHDTLEYFSKDPVYRHFHHNNLTFGMLYNFTENFVLPFSHDEVVHGKRSMLSKMPGDRWQQFANLRLLYTYQFVYPGKKLVFMGAELAQWEEWREDTGLAWSYLIYPEHRGVMRLLEDLNRLYTDTPALYGNEFNGDGFAWIDCHDAAQSVVSFVRWRGDDLVVVVLNFTPVPRRGYRIGLPRPGRYFEVFNSDSAYYGGSNVGNGQILDTESQAWMNQPCSVELTLPPLGALVLKPGT